MYDAIWGAIANAIESNDNVEDLIDALGSINDLPDEWACSLRILAAEESRKIQIKNPYSAPDEEDGGKNGRILFAPRGLKRKLRIGDYNGRISD